MSMIERRWTKLLAATISMAGMWHAPAWAEEPAEKTQQPAVPAVEDHPADEQVDPWIKKLSDDPNDPLVKKYAAARKERLNIEREMKLIRAHYFRGIRKPEIRQKGIDKLKAYTDPSVYPLLLDLFDNEGDDVHAAILDQLAAQKTDVADATIAWAAAFSKDESYRHRATDRLLARIGEAGEISNRVKSVVAAGLMRENTREVAGAANLAVALHLFEAIPMLINAQVAAGANGGGGNGGGGEQKGALADIVIGKQQAFVADLQPVVGDNAVGFDPELGVVTDGVILRVLDAYVITYRVDVHNSLNQLASAGWGGQDVSYLGWDQAAWKSWYANEFQPYRTQIEVATQTSSTP